MCCCSIQSFGILSWSTMIKHKRVHLNPLCSMYQNQSSINLSLWGLRQNILIDGLHPPWPTYGTSFHVVLCVSLPCLKYLSAREPMGYRESSICRWSGLRGDLKVDLSCLAVILGSGSILLRFRDFVDRKQILLKLIVSHRSPWGSCFTFPDDWWAL